jgi:hypothetical protein
MHSLYGRSLFVLVSLGAAGGLLSGSTAAIGMVSANGSFEVNSSKVWNTGTLFDGSTIETAKAPSDLRLNSGAQLRLATESRAKVYAGRVVLERGSGQVESSVGYAVEARNLKIQSASPETIARVQLGASNRVMVAAVGGAVRVTNSNGILVANIGAGDAMSFDPQAGAAGPTKVTGCLVRKDGKYLVMDETTNVTLEVKGAGLEKEVGNRVEITGAADSAAPSVGGASQVIRVSAIKQTAKGGCSSVAKKVGATSAAGAAGAAGAAAAGAGGTVGIATATTVAIVGGVAAAATVGGLAAAGTFSGEEAQPNASR